MLQQPDLHLTSRTAIHDGRRFFEAARALAPQVFHIDRVVTVQARKGVVSMPALAQHVDGEVVMWRRSASVEEVVQFFPKANIYSDLVLRSR